jgi:DMSO/TMAO reductase YedYZ heme-binding membrane subunit
MFKKIIFQGVIPYLTTIKKILLILALVLPFSVFFNYMQFTMYAKIGWYVLVCVLSIRPLADIFPDFRILRTLISFRREFGIFSGMMILAHFVGFLLAGKVPFFSIFTTPMFWDFKIYLVYGILGIIVLIPVLLTSNEFSKRILGKGWRVLQKFSYLFFLLGGLHVITIGKGTGPIEIIIVAVLWLLAKFKFKIRFPWFNKQHPSI